MQNNHTTSSELSPAFDRRVGDRREDSLYDPGYRILDTPELRVKYLHLTDEMINKIAQQGTEAAVFLDKSARPVAWLMHNLWDQLAPRNDDGTIPPEPEIKFMNIDREQWGAVLGRSESGVIDISRVPAER